MRVLGIETSCDETSAAVVSADKAILSHVLLSQMTVHQPYGGVIPEVAARAHLAAIGPVVAGAMREAGVTWADIDGIAATGGPGLIGGVIVGTMVAKTLASYHKKPYIAVNHLEGHALTVRLVADVPFPYLLLLVSGGHCQLLVVKGVGHYDLLGETRDDAVGEAFDKVAKLLGLDYPGGPAVETCALHGNPNRFVLPKPLMRDGTLDFSFSGLKTAVMQLVQQIKEAHGTLSAKDRADIAASFQETVSAVLAAKSMQALDYLKAQDLHPTTFVVAGGVAANKVICAALQKIVSTMGVAFEAPPLALCTDNGAMIAWAGLERFRAGLMDNLDFAPKPRWPLMDLKSQGRE